MRCRAQVLPECEPVTSFDVGGGPVDGLVHRIRSAVASQVLSANRQRHARRRPVTAVPASVDTRSRETRPEFGSSGGERINRCTRQVSL